MSIRLFTTSAALCALVCTTAQAGVITGQLRDTQGMPVANAIFEFQGSGAGDAIVIGGSSDANGNFTTTVTPDGNYRMIVYPLPPPQSSVVVKRFQNIVVGATTNNLGTLLLGNGVQVSGRVVNSAGTPLVSVGMEFLSPADSQWLDFTNHDTNALGQFNVNVPYGECEVGFEPGPVPYYGGPGTGPHSILLNNTGSMDLGDVVMPAGYVVSTSVRRASDNSAVEDVGVEFVRRSSGRVAYTPHNRTDANGNLGITVAPDNYDVRYVPRSNDGLITTTLFNRTVPPGGPLGTVSMEEGVELRGRVRGADNVGYPGTTVQLFHAVTNAEVFVDNGVTNATGNYSVIAPPGTYNVKFSASFAIPFGTITYNNVVIPPNTNHVDRDGTLPSVPFGTLVGSGVPGLGGITPAIVPVGGAPRLGNAAYSLNFSQARGAALGVVIYSFGPSTAPHGPQLYARSALALSGTPGVAGDGAGAFQIPIPNDASLAGQTLHAWLHVRDGASNFGVAATQELRATITP